MRVTECTAEPRCWDHVKATSDGVWSNLLLSCVPDHVCLNGVVAVRSRHHLLRTTIFNRDTLVRTSTGSCLSNKFKSLDSVVWLFGGLKPMSTEGSLCCRPAHFMQCSSVRVLSINYFESDPKTTRCWLKSLQFYVFILWESTCSTCY